MENEYQLTHGTEENNADLSHLSFDDEDEIYDSPEFQATEPEEEEIGQYYEEEESTEEPSLIARLLRDKGIQDPSKIKFADDDDNLQDVDWNDLSLEEQYNMHLKVIFDSQENIDKYCDFDMLISQMKKQNQHWLQGKN